MRPSLSAGLLVAPGTGSRGGNRYWSWLVLGLLLPDVATAGTLSGLGIPVSGGTQGGLGTDGAQALAATPTAAIPARGEAFFDVGRLQTNYAYTLEGQEAQGTPGGATVPSFGIAIPVRNVGFGFMLFVPEGRSGAAAEDGPQRFHTITGRLQVVEGDLAMAGRPNATWTLGAGLRLVNAKYAGKKAIDTGALLQGILGEDSGVPIGDPFLEGTQELSTLSGNGLGGSIGARADLEGDAHLFFSVRSPVRVKVEGPVMLVPSLDLAVAIEGEATAWLWMPPEVAAALRFPVGPAALTVEGTFIAWKMAGSIVAEIDGLSLTSEDESFEALLAAYGLDDGDFFGGLGTSRTATGMRNILTGGAALSFPAGPVTVKTGAWFSPAAVPDENLHPGNVDFSSWDLRLAGSYLYRAHLGIAMGLDVFRSAERVVTTSGLSLTNEPASGMVFPSGNGRYSLSARRLGVTVSWFF